MPETNENQPLLPRYNAGHPAKKSKLTSFFFASIPVIKAIPDGMAKSYSTFGPIAILYYPGMWLVVPIFSTVAITMTDEVFHHLQKHYPENNLITYIAKISNKTNQIAVGFLEDFGFTWGMFITLAAQFGGVEYTTNSFAKIISPALSLLPAILIGHTRYQHAENKHNNLVVEMIANSIHAANSPTFILNLLQQLAILNPTSALSSAVIFAAGFMGLLAAVCRHPHPRLIAMMVFLMSWLDVSVAMLDRLLPLLAVTINGLIEIYLENPSLALAFFAMPNFMYAANHHNEINDSFFMTNVGISGTYLVMLTIASIIILSKKIKKLTDENANIVDLDSNFETLDNHSLNTTSYASDYDAQHTDYEIVDDEQLEPEVIETRLSSNTQIPVNCLHSFFTKTYTSFANLLRHNEETAYSVNV